jgi:hypothetical protein
VSHGVSQTNVRYEKQRDTEFGKKAALRYNEGVRLSSME